MTAYCSSDNVTVDLAGQPAGVYFIKITDKNGNKYSEKVVKD
ncbi:MAG: T9SS type A sorting domain-containing protein [Bacteroidales bacterium]|nr:T9SS type A sorting domain-containing protein [Bacteroidales bacterium]